jgi:hypothetical protein
MYIDFCKIRFMIQEIINFKKRETIKQKQIQLSVFYDIVHDRFFYHKMKEAMIPVLLSLYKYIVN